MRSPGAIVVEADARDNDGDGHYNKKTYEPRHGRSAYGYGYARTPYYGYRPYSYYPRTSFSYYSAPRYYTTTRVYRGVAVQDDLSTDIQRALRSRGYYRGSIDGDIGPGTRSAIRAYQRDRGLPVTGRIDTALLRSLHIG